MDSDKIATAVFEKVYFLTVRVEPEGTGNRFPSMAILRARLRENPGGEFDRCPGRQSGRRLPISSLEGRRRGASWGRTSPCR